MRALSTLGIANRRTADLLVRLNLIRSDWVPIELVDEPSRISHIIDRFKRWKIFRLEVEDFMKMCEASDRSYHGQETGDGLMRTDIGELWDEDLEGKVWAYTPFCETNEETLGFQFWR